MSLYIIVKIYINIYFSFQTEVYQEAFYLTLCFKKVKTMLWIPALAVSASPS